MQPCWASICAGLAGVEGVAAALGDEKAEEEGNRERGQVFEYGLLWGVHDSSCSRGRVARPGDESGTALSVVLRVQEYFQSSPKSGPPLTLEALACLHPSKEGEAVIETKHFTIGDFQRLYKESREISPGPRAKVAVGIAWADTYCKECEHVWRAHNGGDLTHSLGHYHLDCPNCRTQEAIPGGTFK